MTKISRSRYEEFRKLLMVPCLRAYRGGVSSVIFDALHFASCMNVEQY